jgi:hypothetical protein
VCCLALRGSLYRLNGDELTGTSTLVRAAEYRLHPAAKCGIWQSIYVKEYHFQISFVCESFCKRSVRLQKLGPILVSIALHGWTAAAWG